MGLTTLNDPERYGLTLVLGGGEVRLLDMTYAYGVFANEGVAATPRSIMRVEDSRGNIIDEYPIETRRVLDKNAALMISDVLSDNVARTPLWGANSLVNFPNRSVASKTGSTNNLRDAWLMGYAPNIAVGTWVGNNNNDPMGGGLSGLIVTPMWRKFMDLALTKLPEESFTQPTINRVGLKPILRGEFINTASLLEKIQLGETLNIGDIYNNIHTILYFVDKDNPTGPEPTNPATDPQYENWEYGVQKWKEETYGIPSTEPQTESSPEEMNN
jgi:membrane peptidoglycan carboxypeptidase